jgi:hypothetical protein
MSYHATKRYGRTLNVYYYRKDTDLRRLHTMRFQPYGILENAKLEKE